MSPVVTYFSGFQVECACTRGSCPVARFQRKECSLKLVDEIKTDFGHLHFITFMSLVDDLTVRRIIIRRQHLIITIIPCTTNDLENFLLVK